MKKTLTQHFLILTLILTSMLFVAAVQAEWKAPPEADKLSNPMKGNAEAIKSAKKIYMQQCAICHGNSGKGDGMAGMALKPKPANFTDAKIQAQSDGAIYWKLTEGRAPMAGYKDILTDDQRWQMVNYMRTFKK